jgi:hypothetical protein
MMNLYQIIQSNLVFLNGITKIEVNGNGLKSIDKYKIQVMKNIK